MLKNEGVQISCLVRSSQPRTFLGLPARVTIATTDSATTASCGARCCTAAAGLRGCSGAISGTEYAQLVVDWQPAGVWCSAAKQGETKPRLHCAFIVAALPQLGLEAALHATAGARTLKALT